MARFERGDRAVQNCRREIPANCGPFSTVSKKAGKARLGGGDQMDREWMPTTQSIERVSDRSQERDFSMQRQRADFARLFLANRVETF